MSELGDLETLETLHRDLLALSESRLLNVERLWVQLEARVADFRRLLDKTSRNEHSRKALTTGMEGCPHHSYEASQANSCLGREAASA